MAISNKKLFSSLLFVFVVVVANVGVNVVTRRRPLMNSVVYFVVVDSLLQIVVVFVNP